MSVFKQYLKDRARFVVMMLSDWFEDMMDYRWFRRTIGISEGLFIFIVIAIFIWLQ